MLLLVGIISSILDISLYQKPVKNRGQKGPIERYFLFLCITDSPPRYM